MGLNNLSDGKTDGIILMYVKDRKVYPVGLTESQAIILDEVIALPFSDSSMKVIFDKPQGNSNQLGRG